MRLYLLSLSLVLGAVMGCSSSATTLVVQVEGKDVSPTAVTVTVFDRFGLLGRNRVDQPVLPGSVTVQGLPDTVQTLRVVAAAESPRALGGLRLETEPRTRMTRLLTLTADVSDADGDSVPDSLDDCPLAADPDQNDSDGDGVGDSCPRSGGGGDLAVADLGAPADLAGVDLAGADLAAPPPDLLPAAPLLVEGFEGGLGAPWSTNVSNGSLTVDSVHVRSGTRALHVHTNAITPPSPASAQVDIVETSVVPLPDFYLRAWVFVPGGADPTSVAIFAVDQNGSPFKGVNLNLEGGSFSSFNNIPTTAVSLKTTTPAMPTNQFVCLEWRIKESTNGYARLFLQNSEVTPLSTNQNTQPTPPLGLVGIGLIAFPSGNVAARDVWFDDIIIDANPIGCAK